MQMIACNRRIGPKRGHFDWRGLMRLSEVSGHHADEHAVCRDHRSTLHAAKACATSILPEREEVRIDFDIRDDERMSGPERPTAHAAVAPGHAPKGLNEGCGKIARRHQEQLAPHWKLDIAELCAVRGDSIVEH